jgi:hypothetical protein
VPLGIRSGQILIADQGSTVGDYFNAGWDSSLQIVGGTVGLALQATHARIDVQGGSVGDRMEAHLGSAIHLSDGAIGANFDLEASQLVVTGGAVGERLIVGNSSVVTMNGGAVGANVQVLPGGELNLRGGRLGADLAAADGSEVHLFGRRFALNGIDITTSLGRNAPSTIIVRDVTLTGELADGSPIQLLLTSNPSGIHGYFRPSALLTVTLVPEPKVRWLVMSAMWIPYRGRCRRPRAR